MERKSGISTKIKQIQFLFRKFKKPTFRKKIITKKHVKVMVQSLEALRQNINDTIIISEVHTYIQILVKSTFGENETRFSFSPTNLEFSAKFIGIFS